jgi:hypothetical protein
MMSAALDDSSDCLVTHHEDAETWRNLGHEVHEDTRRIIKTHERPYLRVSVVSYVTEESSSEADGLPRHEISGLVNTHHSALA